MLQKHAVKFRVMFNDAHANFPKNNQIPQGGPSSFASKFSKYFNTQKDIELISMLFSHNQKDDAIFTRKNVYDRDYYELVYPRDKFIESYKIKTTKKEYLDFLEPWIKKMEEVLIESKANLVFLNGFSLTNWIMMEASYRLKIPSIIQHAGLWKKEIITSDGYFSPSISKIFSSFEKETYKKTSHQIFLNEFSKKEFFDIHNLKNNKQEISIIPLPIEIKTKKKIEIKKQAKQITIGVVSRWDRIKNHGAIYRLAKYIENKKLPFKINVVANIQRETPFINKYKKIVNIVSPMQPVELKKFYDKQDIVIIPSRFDVSPTVLMEALLQGKPVLISNNVGWVSDFKKFNLKNLIFDYRASGENIYKKIEILLDNNQKYIKEFKKFQNKIINKHNTENVFTEYYKLFKKIIKNDITK